jgi:hypothetical protein
MKSLVERAAQYHKQAAHLRRLAESEVEEDLRLNLLDLAQQYEELANALAFRQHDDA